jgi:hypothetical protein
VNTLILAGGSGFRVFEPFLHLCAAGLGPDAIQVIAIEPDGPNGNAERTNDALMKYLECQRLLKDKVRTSKEGTSKDIGLFRTRIDRLDGEDRPSRLKLWSPVDKGDSLAKILDTGLLSPEGQDMVDLLYTADEQRQLLDRGFRGHPAIGAAALSLVELYAERSPWKQLLNGIIAGANGPGSRVFIVGSVFGGTGAAAIHPVARFLRNHDKIDQTKLNIAVAALVPYFTFDEAASTNKTPELAARAQWFTLATKAAVEFYGDLRENQDWPFNAVYWVGDNAATVLKSEPGGAKQKNPGHFVDFLAALACVEYFTAPEPPVANACYYAGPAADSARNLLRWSDVPHLDGSRHESFRSALCHQFLMGMAHLGFFEPLLQRKELYEKPYYVPWYAERFVGKGDAYNLDSEAARAARKSLSDYYSLYLFRWWSEALGPTVHLFNRAALHAEDEHRVSVELNRIGNIDYPDSVQRATCDPVDDIFSEMVEAGPDVSGEDGISQYAALLAHGATETWRQRYEVRRRSGEARS